MHPTEGQLRAFFDGELSDTELARMQAHLEMCPPCRQHAESLQVRAGQVQVVLSALDPTAAESAAPAREARSHFEVYSSTKEKIPMFKKLFAPRFRPLWATLAVAVILTAAISLPPVRAIANDFLGLFRVQQVSAVPFDPLNLPANFNFDQQSITQLMAENLKYEIVGKAQDAATSSEASSLAGIPVRLPASSLITGDLKLSIEPGTKMSFKVDLERIQSILSDAGFGDIKLPKELDGTTVKAELPMIVTAVYGDNTQSRAAAGRDPDAEGGWCSNCTVLVQLASPTIETPEGVDLAAIGKAYLRLTGMSDAEADSFSQTVDWSTTLVIPVPNFASRETVSVDGVDGILIQQSPSYDTQYMLIWAKDGLVYALTGYGTRSTALEIANSLK
jgi:hypothetical protein